VLFSYRKVRKCRGKKQEEGYWILDAGCWILDAGYWILDAGRKKYAFLKLCTPSFQLIKI
jgi:hypothetical protein